MEMTVARHCVASSPDTGLSPLQQALVEASEPVRIADAPTGAGKTFAFQDAMTRHGQRVLFIVPTRRLAQNLASGLIRELKERNGWPLAAAEGKVAIWSSDATRQLKEAGIRSVAGHRLRQVTELYPSDGGEMIVAIPESLSHLLLQRRAEAGHSDKGIFDILTQFDHVVFDEFHTIEARGFGLAAVCAKLASTMTGVRAKVSFLSATPIEIRPVLLQLGVPEAAIRTLHEAVGDEGRPLHGDVRLCLSDAPSLAALVAEQKEAIASEVRAGRQAVIIYNALSDLRLQLPEIRAVLDSVGVAPSQVLVINSIDDSGKNATISAGFSGGRDQDPDAFDVLIATASVEMGVTFRAANLLLMEPGFDPMNFLQRYGRAARRGETGQVWVRSDKAMRDSTPWLRALDRWVRDHAGTRVRIEDLTQLLSQGCLASFNAPMGDDVRFFGTMPSRAAFAAGLYWNAMMSHFSAKGPRLEHLREHQPAQAKMLYALLKTVRRLEDHPRIGAAAREWCDRFQAQAYTLRDIGKRVRVIEGDGRVIGVDVLWLRRSTDIEKRFSVQLGTDGEESYVLPAALDDYLLDERNRVVREATVYFPHTSETAILPVNGELIDAWCRKLNERSGRMGMVWDSFPEAMAAAEKLVRCTGLVVCDDDTFSMGAVHGVL